MRKRIGFGLVVGSLIAGVLAASFFLSETPAPLAEPTRVPFPTFTPTPNSSSIMGEAIVGEVQGDYADLAAQYQQALAQGMAVVGQLLATPQLGDATWRAQVANAMTEVENAYALLLRLQPDDDWRPFHQELLAGAADCNAAMRVLDLALDEQDRNAVSVVAALLGRCQSRLTVAGQLVADGKPIAP